MQSLKIYLAGKMYGLDFDQMYMWRRNFKKKLRKINIDQGFNYNLTIINPVEYYNYIQKKHQTETEVRDFDLKHLTTSDIVVVNLDGLNTSDGTKLELFEAYYHHKIPVIAFGEVKRYNDLHPWIKDCITRVEENIDDVIQYILEFYMYEE